jgi:hypothetical protein
MLSPLFQGQQAALGLKPYQNIQLLLAPVEEFNSKQPQWHLLDQFQAVSSL